MAEYCADPRMAFCGTVLPNELEFLQKLVSMANRLDGPILEIGTLFGFTTQHLANWKVLEKELITVDDFTWNPVGFDNKTHQAFTKRILYYLIHRANTTLVPLSNTEFYCNYRGEVPSMVFIDASHRFIDVVEDVRWAKEKGISIISGHDYSDDFPGVIRAVNETFGKDNVKTVGTVWAVSA
jgi:phospholipid N-methyltransferase